MMEAVQHLAGNSHTLMQKLHLVVWTQLSSWLNLSHLPPIDSATTIYGWWTKCRARVQKEFCRTLDGVLIYFWWNIWKECNRPTFNNDFKQVIDAAYLIKDGILQFATAHLGSTFTTTDSQSVFLLVFSMCLLFSGATLTFLPFCYCIAQCGDRVGWALLAFKRTSDVVQRE